MVARRTSAAALAALGASKPDWRSASTVNHLAVIAYWKALSHEERFAIALNASRLNLQAPKRPLADLARLTPSACAGIAKAHRVLTRLADEDAGTVLESEGLTTYTACVDLLQPALWVVRATGNLAVEIDALLDTGSREVKP